MHKSIVINRMVLTVVTLILASELANSAIVTDHDRVVTCYISTWAVYRPGFASYNLEAFDATLCTHAIYAFAGLDEQNNTIKSLDPWQDLREDYGKGGYERLTSMRKSNPHLKVLLAIGGWEEGSEKYSNFTNNATNRQEFVINALDYVRQYDFDGLDLDWEYPTQRGGDPVDRGNFVALVQELSTLFKKHNLLLTSAFAASKTVIDEAYDIPALSNYLDFLHIMCYDYHGTWDGKVGPNAPLASSDFLSVEYTIKHLLNLGAPANKIVLGLPFYGRTFVSRIVGAGMGDDAEEVGFPGPATKENGFMGYNEFCEELKRNPNDWRLTWDAVSAEMVATKSNDTASQVVVYDSTRSIATKVRFAMRHNLAGLLAWSIDTDDFNGLCKPELDTYEDFIIKGNISRFTIPPPVSGKYPLLKTINNAIVVASEELAQENVTPDVPEDVTADETEPYDPSAARSLDATTSVAHLIVLISFLKVIATSFQSLNF
ncbi:probable chitinase 2 [Anopheles aquasalis]|uniref:probable chitinase 2 n=1 Tax=Anopheles aquasalis TaxID=42839 RepID=UPI00215A728B|nr:probable chitinase 2 [Anopheles aquasalis]